MNIKKIDALELLQSLDDKSVDLVLTDPPYYKSLKVDWDNQWKTKDDYLTTIMSRLRKGKLKFYKGKRYYFTFTPTTEF